MQFRAEVVGLEQWVARIKGADKIVMEELRKAGQRSGLRVEAGAKKLVPVDTGNLRRSISTVTTTQGIYSTTKVGTNVPYARAVEFGRGAGTTQPPVAPIARWLAKKGSDANPFVVARAIGRRGIAGRPFLTKAFKELQPKIRQEFQDVPKRVIARLKGAG